MADIQTIHAFLKASGLAHEIVACDPDDAETAVFAAKYGYSLDCSANCILVKTKTGATKFVACVVLATTRLDVNKRVRKLLGARKVSFAAPEDTRRLTGMDLGGVTPLCLPDDLPVWIDAAVMGRETIILGGGDRHSKIIVAPGIFDQVPNVEVIDGLALAIG